jgi:hypothetical protein
VPKDVSEVVAMQPECDHQPPVQAVASKQTDNFFEPVESKDQPKVPLLQG